MRKVLSIVLTLTILMGNMALLALPAFADTDENISSIPENITEDVTENVTEGCNHNWTNGAVTQQPTCSTSGKQSVICSICGATGEVTIAPTSHNFGNPSPVDDANHKRTCSDCGKEEFLSHTWNEGTVIQSATCKDEGTKILTCTGCSHTKTDTIPVTGQHTLGSRTPNNNETHTGICTVCSATISEAHTWDQGSVTKPATCMDTGLITYTCTGCQFSQEQVLDTTDHDFTRWLNSDELLHKRICKVCQLEEIGEHSYYTEWSHDEYAHYHECSACGSQKDAKEHFPGPPATEDNPQLCVICMYVITPALNHTHKYEQEWIHDDDYHWHNCPECEEKGDYAKHNFENDCDPDCEDCGYRRKTTHSFSKEWSHDEENHYYECERCGDTRDKKPHTLGADARTCDVCGYEIFPDQEETQGQTTSTTPPAPKKKSFPVWGALVIAGVAAALIPVFSFFQRDD